MRFAPALLCLSLGIPLGITNVTVPAVAETPDVAEQFCRDRFLGRVGIREAQSRVGGSLGPPRGGLARMAPLPSVAPPVTSSESAVLRAFKVLRQSPRVIPDPVNRDRYPNADPNPVKIVRDAPVSTFSADVDTASYALVRRYLTRRGKFPPADAVRPEELINAFDYAYPSPDTIDGAFRPEIAMFPSPWNPDTRLLRIGIKAYDLAPDARPPANLVFLLDVSGSMRGRDRLPLAKTAICMLVHELKPGDKVSMVVYAGAAGTVLEPTPASARETILTAMDRLTAGGSTAGGRGIELAYSIAEKNFIKGAANRIILATDGDFNVGIADPRKLRDYVARKRDTGIFLTVLGFGIGNYNDRMMQLLAQSGNGVAAYIDSVAEARKILVRGLTGSIITVARDVKFQVEFNPARVAEYRLIGYETRLLNRTDFNNDRVDAGDIGSGHTVTALYELAMTGSKGRLSGDLRYGRKQTAAGKRDGELGFLRLRFKAPGAQQSRLIERKLSMSDMLEDISAAPADARFAASVAWFADALRNSAFVKPEWNKIRKLADGAIGEDRYGDRRAFVKLVDAAKKIAASM